mmetsp:Transcript_55893/g.98687  ORF Transcript_55893/g.98687 Transcript_55893/m.98687 type:complete len:102 (+) Transcript_55893:28-333(+)
MLGRAHATALCVVVLLCLIVQHSAEAPVARPVDPELHWNPGETDGDPISPSEMEDAMQLLEADLGDPAAADTPERGRASRGGGANKTPDGLGGVRRGADAT